MKLNENGDFCLLYVEPADEKQSLFTTIGEQQKPVVLMLSLGGQPRSRLFQRPEDFSDLKHVRRQSGVSIVFVTAGSEFLTQMAARYGFPSYPSIDDFADFLAHGRHALREDDAEKVYPPPLRGVRTGPLMPSAALAQLAALRQPLSTSPLTARAEGEAWTGHEKSVQPVNAGGPWTGHEGGGQPMSASEPWTGHESSVLPAEYTEAFHEAQTMPIGGAARLAWPLAGDAVSSVWPATPPTLASVRNPPSTPGRVYGYQPSGPLARGMAIPEEDMGVPPQPRVSEIPRRRSAQLADEPHTRHPGWPVEEHMFESGEPPRPARPLASAQGLRNPAARPTRDLREPSLAAVSALSDRMPARPLSGPPGTAPARPAAETSGAGIERGSGGTRPAPVPPVTPPVARAPQKRGSVWPLLVILSLLIIAGGALGSFVAIAHVAPTSSTVARPVGSIAFLSSEQLNENTSQGLDDQVQISLHGLGTPASGKSYYAWLLGDSAQEESQSILLGRLTVLNGTASLFYSGDALHTNLLQITSRFLVTEENSSVMPLMPSPDTHAWRYYGALPAIPDPNDAHHFSFLNHLRHLLADEPILDEMELPGGLNNWFSRNTEELIQLTSNARDRWQNNRSLTSVRAQGEQILSYLDGMSFLAQDLPTASANVPVSLDTHLAALGLLDVRGTTQNPPGYIDQIIYHLNGLLNAPGSPSNVRTVAGQILPALSNVTTWLQKLRSDTKKLLALTDAQLGQAVALSLLDDMVLQASNAYSGTTDPTTGQAKPGVVWIHQQLQSIATINVDTYVLGQTPVPEVAPSSKVGPAFLQPLLNLWRELEQIV